jgi:hypothetical protein
MNKILDSIKVIVKQSRSRHEAVTDSQVAVGGITRRHLYYQRHIHLTLPRDVRADTLKSVSEKRPSGRGG